MILTVTLLITCVKMLLIPSYRSTDFEVHRNWLAITHSLPINKWYFEDRSEWTLDYPPLFAYFEYILSLVASVFDKNMLIVDNLNYESKETVLFQRLSVIVTDFVYIYGVYKCCKALPKSWRTEVVLPILLITNCGLLMVDHIHFQYNGIMYGILLISIAYMQQGDYIKSAIFFTVLLNMKHIYIYLAPAYFIYLLKNYCIYKEKNRMRTVQTVKNLLRLGSTVVIIFVTFIPFYDHLGQVLSRMFPFKRGLCHAYWAPNFWALYNSLDKGLVIFLTKTGLLAHDSSSVAVMTGGLVQEFSHQILPSVKPVVTMVLTGAMMVPAMVKLWTLDKRPLMFLRCLVLCALTSFLFSWHVHEKAILMAIIPLSLLSMVDRKDARIFLLLGVTGHYSLFPLLFPQSVLVVKVLLLLLYSTYAFHSFSKIFPVGHNKIWNLPLLNTAESLYILGLVLLFLYEHVIHFLIGFHNKLPFLPLLLTSVYCSIGVIYCWILYYHHYLTWKVTASKSNNKKIN